MARDYKNKTETNKIPKRVNELKGKFITFEGPEGSGKTTHLKLLAKSLKDRGYNVVLLQDPGSTEIGKRIRSILLDHNLSNMSPYCELCLYLAARCQLVEERIKGLLRQGKIILCDRFNDATLAYQGYAADISIDFLTALTQDYLFKGVMPDLTILLDIEVETGLKRILKGRLPDRQEKKDISFHKKVRAGYLDLAKKHPERIKVVSSRDPIKIVQDKIKEIVRDVLD